MAANCQDLNNLFQQVINQFQEPIYKINFRQNPYLTLVPRSEFTDMDGLQPKVVTSTMELPTSYPTGLANLELSDGTADGTGTDPCDLPTTTVLDGNIVRDYQLEVDAFNTRTFCLTDLQFSWQAEQMISNVQQLLGQFTTVRVSDWYRIKNICMINKKVSTQAAGAVEVVENGDCDLDSLSSLLPTAELDWDHLNPLYDEQIQLGAGEHAVGFSEGQPLFALAVGPGYKRKLWQDDTLVRDTVNWGDAFQNFTARGINTSINGFIPNVDNFIPRLDGSLRFIYPTRNTNATKGRQWEPNPAYRAVSSGRTGAEAVYELAYLMPRDIWEAKFRPVGATQFGQAGFNPVNYVGDIQWINNKTFCGSNDQGTKGYYRLDLQMAAKSIFPQFGSVIMTLAKD
jgi:hypothetical protein